MEITIMQSNDSEINERTFEFIKECCEDAILNHVSYTENNKNLHPEKFEIEIIVKKA